MRMLIAVVLLTIWVAPAGAQNADDAIVAWERGDYRTAFDIWQPLAERGDKDAPFGLVNLYTYGRGVPRDYAKAYMWLLIGLAEQPQGSPRVRDYLAGFLTADEKKEAERNARAWIERHRK